MEPLIVLLLLVVPVLILLLPILALIKASGAERKAEGLERRLWEVETELSRFRKQAEGKAEATPAPQPGHSAVGQMLAKRMAETALASATVAPAPASATAVSPQFESARAVAPAPQPPGPVSIPAPTVAPTVPPPLPPILPPAPPSKAVAAAPPTPIGPFNWEQFMGVKLFAWLGGLALFLAVAYLVKYSIDHDLISPEIRVSLGFLTGLGCAVGGVLLQRKQYRVTSQSLCATGVVILYAVTFACHAVYEKRWPFFGQVQTFLLMMLITTAAFLLAVRLEALVVAILGMLGGFLTPVLLSTGVDNPAGLFGYIALLDVGLVGVALHRRWFFLTALAALGTVIMQIAWAAEFFTVSKVYIALAVWLGFDAFFLAAFWLSRRREQGADWFAGTIAGVGVSTMLFTFYLLSFPELGTRPGTVFAFVLGADLCLLVLAALRPRFAAAQLAGGALAFLLLSTWTVQHLTPGLLDWALGMYFVFAVLHSLAPMLLQRLAAGARPPPWMQAFPPLALILVSLPILKLPEVSFLVWPVVLLIDALAILMAAIATSLLSIAAVLVLTVATLFLWLVRTPVEALAGSSALLIIGGFAVFFFIVGMLASKWMRGRLPDDPLRKLGFFDTTRKSTPEELQAQIPALSAILPFVLLMMVAVRVPMTNPTSLFGLALLLVVLLLGVTRHLRIEVLPAIGLACTLALEHVWHFKQFGPASAPALVLSWYLFFAGVFVLFPFLFGRQLTDKVVPWATAALSGPLHFYLVHRLFKTAYPDFVMGLLPAAFAVPMLVCLWVIVQRFPPDHARRNAVLALFGGAALFFITLIFPIQFDRQWITIGWALEGVALCWLFHRIPHPGLRLVGIALLLVSFVRLAANPAVLSYHPRSSTAIWNWYLYAYGIVAACHFAAVGLLAAPRDRVLGLNVRPLLVGLGTVLAFLLVNIEIADAFTEPGQRTLTFEFSGNRGRDMTYSIAWGLFALVLVIAGLWRRAGPARYAGIGLLVVTLLKVFFHDLAHLNQLYRVGALAGVAMVAILASFLYQRFLANLAKPDAPRPSNGPPA